MTSTDQAVLLFQQGFNCSQAVCAAHAEALGLSRELALKIAAGFGGGMGRHGEVCGAVTGAIMVVGLKIGSNDATDTAAKEDAYALTDEVIVQFKERHGSILCRELLGCDILQPEGRQYARETRLFATRCPLFVHDAAEIVSALIED
jgi:C_GCAxxG_C_C family probable redox protein